MSGWIRTSGEAGGRRLAAAGGEEGDETAQPSRELDRVARPCCCLDPRCLVFPIECLAYTRSIKYKLIIKLITQFMTNIRDESFKPN